MRKVVPTPSTDRRTCVIRYGIDHAPESDDQNWDAKVFVECFDSADKTKRILDDASCGHLRQVNGSFDTSYIFFEEDEDGRQEYLYVPDRSEEYSLAASDFAREEGYERAILIKCFFGKEVFEEEISTGFEPREDENVLTPEIRKNIVHWLEQHSRKSGALGLAAASALKSIDAVAELLRPA